MKAPFIRCQIYVRYPTVSRCVAFPHTFLTTFWQRTIFLRTTHAKQNIRVDPKDSFTTNVMQNTQIPVTHLFYPKSSNRRVYRVVGPYIRSTNFLPLSIILTVNLFLHMVLSAPSSHQRDTTDPSFAEEPDYCSGCQVELNRWTWAPPAH